MRNSIIRTVLYLFSLILAVACDTTEDAFWVGDKPKNAISADGPVTLNADGTAVALNLSSICEWTTEIQDNENNFEVYPASGKGNMTVEIKASPNYNNRRQQTCKLIFRASDLDEQVSVDVTQAALTLEMEQNDINVPETGDAVVLDFTSTAGWVFETWPAGSTPLKDINWLEFNPGFSGEGDYRKIQVKLDILPNYTLSERTVTLGLNPQNTEVANQISSLPKEFSITQAAGTLPTISNPDTVSVSMREISFRFNYDSKSSVDDYGVKLLSEDGRELRSVTASTGNSESEMSGVVNVVIDNLDEGTTYGIQPYVTNKVGEKLGEVRTVRTKSTLIGASIKEFNLTPSSKSVTAHIQVESDANIYEVGIEVFPLGSDANIVSTENVQLSGAQLVFDGDISSAESLTPNTDYNLVIYVRSAVNEIETAPTQFRTLGLIPDEDDNNRPDIQP